MSYLNIAIKIKNYEQKFSCKFGLTLCSGVITQLLMVCLAEAACQITKAGTHNTDFCHSLWARPQKHLYLTQHPLTTYICISFKPKHPNCVAASVTAAFALSSMRPNLNQDQSVMTTKLLFVVNYWVVAAAT